MHASQLTPRPVELKRSSTAHRFTLTHVPLFHAAWLFAAGIAIAQFAWIRPGFVCAALFPVAALCGLAGFRAQRIVRLPLAALWLLLGIWCAEMEPHPAPSAGIVASSDGLLRTVEGTIAVAAPLRVERAADADENEIDEPSQQIDVRISDIELVNDSEDRQVPMDGAVRLTVRWPLDPDAATRPQGFACGEQIRALVRLLPPQEYRDPGAWSRKEYLLNQGVTATASLSSDRVERLATTQGVPVRCRLAALQQRTSSKLLALPARMTGVPKWLRLSEDDAVMLAAMTTGDRTYLSHALRVGFERTGSFHMLVVSGLHLAIVAGCIFWVARRVRLPHFAATIITIAASFGYAFFTGFATPVQRSLWMVTIYLVGRLVYRARSPLNTIGFAALCLLAASPRSLLDSSFQMTLLAVVAIAGVAAPLLEKTMHPYLVGARDLRTVALDVKLEPRIAQFRVLLRMIASRLQRATSRRMAWKVFPWCIRFGLRCLELFVVSCVVELAMTLPMALYFNRITVFALPVNIFIVPLLTVLMPAALLTLIVATVWPAAAVVPAAFAAFVLHLGTSLVRMFGSFTLGDFRIPGPLLWQSAAFCVLLSAAMLLVRKGYWGRTAAWAAMLLAAIAAVAPRPIDHPKNSLLVEAIDVGQGDSILLITPDGKTLLVDGGGFGGGPHQTPQNFDIGEQVVSPALWARGIRHLDVVALSHAHSDHMGGLPAILRNFHPTELWVGNNPPVEPYEALLREAQDAGIAIRELHSGDMPALGATAIHVLAPMRDYVPGPEPMNNDSLVLRVQYGVTSVLLEGDAEAPIEHAMLTEPDLKSTLLKVGHHGSTSSTTADFLTRVAPEWAVISCGQHNHYGHPRAEVLSDLQAAKVRTYATDIQGARCFALDGTRGLSIPCN